MVPVVEVTTDRTTQAVLMITLIWICAMMAISMSVQLSMSSTEQDDLDALGILARLII